MGRNTCRLDSIIVNVVGMNNANLAPFDEKAISWSAVFQSVISQVYFGTLLTLHRPGTDCVQIRDTEYHLRYWVLPMLMRVILSDTDSSLSALDDRGVK